VGGVRLLGYSWQGWVGSVDVGAVSHCAADDRVGHRRWFMWFIRTSYGSGQILREGTMP
jgi:hypothetical protein